MEGVDLGARSGNERDVDRPARLRVRTNDEIGVLAAVLGLPERRDVEGLENRPVESAARLGIANADLHVVEDDSRPIPVDGHAATYFPLRSINSIR
jgi:hypothetical protein